MANYGFEIETGNVKYADPTGGAVVLLGLENLAPAYSKKVYAKGDLVIYDNKLYAAKAAINPADTAWTGSHWQRTTVAAAIEAKADKT